ncbi:MAG: CRISPR-associated endonuclease Cas2 [Micrococcales bacterium]|nr:CRISPR-associated endonuclease Cas2 [Micrococcales bacterium]
MALTVLAAYDVSDDRSRSRVAATLQRWGDRIQYSLFVCTLEPADIDQMVSAVHAIIDHDADSFIVFRQCGTCWDRHVALGQGEPRKPTLYHAVM